MTMQDVIEPVRRYTAEVRACLADLPGDDLEALTEDLDGHLAEVADEIDVTRPIGEYGQDEPSYVSWDILLARLGTPQAYAAELRQAAGLPVGSARAGASGSVARTVLAWCVLAMLVSVIPVLLLSFASDLGLFGLGPWLVLTLAFMTALGAVMHRVPRWHDVVAATRGVTAPGLPPGAVTEPVRAVATWWLRLLAVGTVLWLIVTRIDAALSLLLLVPWLGTAVIFAVAFGCAPWRATYTAAIEELPDPVSIRRLRDACHARDPGRVVLDYLASLRPAWWLARAVAATALLSALLGNGYPRNWLGFGSWPIGLAVLLVGCGLSVWIGMRNRADAGWNALTAPGNVLALIVLAEVLVR